jgi:hypothetical protein
MHNSNDAVIFLLQVMAKEHTDPAISTKADSFIADLTDRPVIADPEVKPFKVDLPHFDEKKSDAPKADEKK